MLLVVSHYHTIRAFLSLAQFWRARERLCMNRVRSLLRMRCMLLGCKFEPRPNSLSFNLQYYNKRILTLKKPI